MTNKDSVAILLFFLPTIMLFMLFGGLDLTDDNGSSM